MTVLMERPGRYVHVSEGELPPLQRFVLVVDRAPDVAQRRLLGPGAMVLREPDGRTIRLRFDWPSPTLAAAVAAGIREVERCGLGVLRVDSDDWVTAGDIAVRVERSRETVRLWTVGRLGPGGFPPPVNPRRDTTFYSWAEVLPWLRGRLGLDLPEEDPALVAANLALQVRSLLPRIPGGRNLINLIR